MDLRAHSRTPSAGDRTRRSYPSLQHISLAPLSTKFPLDDDAGNTDYLSSRVAGSDVPAHLQTTSYLTSSSVPTTPGVLSDSRNVSYSNLAKRKKLSTDGRPPKSETHLDDLNIYEPLHHQQHHHHHHHHHPPHHHRHGVRRTQSFRPKTSSSQDNEWLLRAGLALSSSAREEKGQSWLAKRDSSTSLVSDGFQDEGHIQYAKRSRSAARKHRSGASTPFPLSRRPSGSLTGSTHTSRLDLCMTAGDLDTGTTLPQDQVDVVPDFVDESVRKRMASVASGSRDESEVVSAAISFEDSRESASVSSSDGEFSDEWDSSDSDEVDEAEMQRLTRERGFGLGSWIDRLVEWTLFSVEEEYPADTSSAARLQTRRVIDPPRGMEDAQAQRDENGSVDTDDDASETETEDQVSEAPMLVEHPGEKGGWEDMRWLLGIARRAVF